MAAGAWAYIAGTGDGLDRQRALRRAVRAGSVLILRLRDGPGARQPAQLAAVAAVLLAAGLPAAGCPAVAAAWAWPDRRPGGQLADGRGRGGFHRAAERGV